MSVLRNARHELFAQGVAKGLSNTQAYLAAGFKASPRAASVSANRLMAKAMVRSRVSDLQDERARMHAQATTTAASNLQVSQQWLMERAEEARALAMENGQPAAAVAAIKELGILSGLRVERRENLNRTLSEMTDEELLNIVRGDEPPTTH